MAGASSWVAFFFVFHGLFILFNINPSFLSTIGVVSGSEEDFSIVDLDLDLFGRDYSPPSPPPPPPHPPSVSCEEDLKGIGSLNTSCQLNTSLQLTDDVYVEGKGSLDILPGITVSCPVPGCSISINMTGDFSLGQNSSVITGTFFLKASNASLHDGSTINTTALAGTPPAQTSGTPQGIEGAGGGHGGRGASCLTDKKKLPEDVWGGDTYSWSSLTHPWSYGSKGGSISKEEDYGGGGGGRIRLEITSFLDVNGSILATGGDTDVKGGGGSGGSISIKAYKMTGSGRISASGGNGLAGGGGGRVSVDVFSRHDDPKVLVHGGRSFGCPENSGAAGTFYDAVPRSLIVSNHNMSTDTDTLLLEFPNQPLWTNVYVQHHAKASVPLLWSRVQVQGQLSLTCGVLSFGLAHYSSSEFELMAEELLMSDSTIKVSCKYCLLLFVLEEYNNDTLSFVYGALRMLVKMFLMWNSKMLIDGGGDAIVATSLLEASNLVVLKESSVIHSNANLGVHGQGLLNLSGPGDRIEAQRLILSLFYSIHVGPGSVLRGPLENAATDNVTPRLYCDLQDCPMELLHPPEDCNVNSSLSFTLQICRVEDITVEGLIKGSVVHFHRARTVVVQSSGTISSSGLGCTGGVGRGKVLSNGLGGGGGHGGKGGDGYYNGSFVEGGNAYGNVDFPCELGSGSGNDSLAGSTAGGGIVGKLMDVVSWNSISYPLKYLNFATEMGSSVAQMEGTCKLQQLQEMLLGFSISIKYRVADKLMGSLEHSLSSLSIDGSLRADGENFGENITKHDYGITNGSNVGPGGGSGGTILLFLHTMTLGDTAVLSSVGGHGSPNGGGGGGGGGGRIHFHWSDIPTGDEYQPIASVEGSIHTGGGLGRNQGQAGENGTVTGKACPKGLYGILCEVALVFYCVCDTISFGLSFNGPNLCRHVQLALLRMSVDLTEPFVIIAHLMSFRIGQFILLLEVSLKVFCLLSSVCSLEELIYTFGGPWLFGLLLLGLLILLALVLSVARMKFVGTDELPGPAPTQQGSQIDHSFPFLESLNEVLETNRAEESQSHVHRMYFMGPNTFSEPWHLPHSPPEQVTEIVYEDAFNRFVDEINALAAYQWWEGSVFSILSILAYPLAWSWQQWRRRRKLQQLREFVRSEYDHACLRSCRSRALYEGLKVQF
ncbi:hypothetical protein HHK36_014211 [Tetracentron sinense]|uniref:Uncharacterized protein n=1 Tax=Tetracentron sinense TaxID=13715 RepID=A0A835DE15_TETSI|nr:hypothetical protein HHK36_014211 [Tetracentron sinense]